MTNIAQHTVNLLTTIIDSADKMTIGQMVDEAYLCLLDTSWDLPVRKYTRKAQVIAELQHVISRIGACPVYAERVPDVTPEKRAEHLEHAEHLRGIFRSHGIDPKDFDACMDYIIGNGNIVPRYWAKIYMDYIHGDDLDATAFDPAQPGSERTAIVVTSLVAKGTQIHQQIERLIVTGQQAALLRADGYTGELEIVDVMPGATPSQAPMWGRCDAITADEALIPSLSVPSVGFYQCLGRGIRITKQNARAIHSRANMNTGKANRFPRGKCAARMVELGWEFNEG